MTRKWKNIVMLCVLALTIGGMIFTLWYAKDNAKTNSNGQITNTQMNGTPPTMPDGNNNSNDNSNNSDNSGNTPNGDSGNNTPPEKPDGDNSNGGVPDMNNNSESDSNSNSDQNSNGGMANATPPDMSNMNQNSNSGLSIGYYIILGGLGLLTSLNIIYLVMTRFNKKTLKEIFKNKDKVIIYILATIILTSALTVRLYLLPFLTGIAS